MKTIAILPPTDGPVVLASAGDEGGIVDCALLENSENGFVAAEPEIVRARVQALIRREGGMIGVIRGVHGVEATIALVLSRFWSTNEFHLERLFGYTYPEHRRSTHAKQLLIFAKSVAAGVDRPLLMAEMSNDITDRKLKLFERQLKTAGTVFSYHHVPPPIHGGSCARTG